MRQFIVVAGLALAVSGCVTTPVQRQVRQAKVEIDRSGEAAMQQQRAMQEGFLREVPTIYVGGAPMPLDKAPDLPAGFDKEVRLQRDVPMTLRMVADYISSQPSLSIRVRVTPDAVAFTQSAGQGGASGGDPMARLLGQQSDPGAFMLHYLGTLKGLLDKVTSRTGTAWHYNRGTGEVVISRYDTRVFRLATLPISSQATSEISNTAEAGGESGGGGSGGAGQAKGIATSGGQTIQSASTIDVLQDAAATVKSMLSKDGAMALDPSTSSLTVTDTPVVLDRVARYVRDQNERLMRQVVLEVKVYSLTLDRGDQYGVDWNMVYQTLSGRYGITTRSGGDLGNDTNALSLSVIDPSYNYNGSEVLLKALATQGTLVARKTVGLVTLSGRPAPVQVASRTGYLAKSATTLVANAGSSTELQQGSVTTGFSMNFLPVVLDDNRVLMQVALSDSSLRALRTIESNGARVESPDVDTKQFMQQVILPSNATLVMSGFDSDSYQGNDRGIGSPRFWVAGGSVDNSRARSMMVILVTPKVI